MIAIDERGVDSSAPEMDCYETLGAQLAPAIKSLSGTPVPTLEKDFISGCLAELDAKGIDYSLINTDQNALDVPAVMSSLPHLTWTGRSPVWETSTGMAVRISSGGAGPTARMPCGSWTARRLSR